MHVAKVDRKLGREWARSKLGKGQPFLVIALGNPVALLDEVPMHVSDERNRTAEADRAELEEEPGELAWRDGWGISHRVPGQKPGAR
jgi:hypothetical protein